MFELTPHSAVPARPLFHTLENHLMVEAYFEGHLPAARLLVDDPAAPRAGFLNYNGRMVFAGDPALADFSAALGQSLTAEIVPAMLAQGQEAALLVFGEGWKTTLETIFAGFKLYGGQRLYFETDPQSAKNSTALPPGFRMRPVDQALLASELHGLEALREEMCSERTSVEDFLEHSFGLCPVFGNELAGWCLSEYNSGDRCEIGIATLEPYQRRGLATSLTQAFLAEARQRGYRRVGWDCWERNTASAATAQKAGLRLVEAYPALVAVFAPEN